MNAIDLGEWAAMATSVSWTLCGLGFAFAGRRVGALAVNQLRIVAALAFLLGVHQIAFGELWPAQASGVQLGYLLVSGLSGLALGDLFYFHCIAVIGPRLGALLMATAPLIAALAARVLLGEALGPQAWAGVVLTVGGVAVVLLDGRGDRGWQPGPRGGSRRLAIAAGLLGAVGQGLGLVLAKIGMLGTPGDAAVAPLSATVVRMFAGMLGVLAVGVARRHVGATLRATRDGRAMAALLVGVAFGPTLGVWLSLVAVRHTDAGVAAALQALPPVLMLPVARVVYGARPGPVALLGTLVAVTGTIVLVLR